MTNRPTVKDEAVRLGPDRSNSSVNTTVRTYSADRQIANEILRDLKGIGIPASAIVVNALRESNLSAEMKKKRQGSRVTLLVGLAGGAVVGFTVALISLQGATTNRAGWNFWQYVLDLGLWSAASAIFFAGVGVILTSGLRKLYLNPAGDEPISRPYLVQVTCRQDQAEQVKEVCRRAGSVVRDNDSP